MLKYEKYSAGLKRLFARRSVTCQTTAEKTVMAASHLKTATMRFAFIG
jgi:hypothetical protein